MSFENRDMCNFENSPYYDDIKNYQLYFAYRKKSYVDKRRKLRYKSAKKNPIGTIVTKTEKKAKKLGF